MYIFVWKEMRGIDARVSTRENLDEARSAILRMEASAMPDHVIWLSSKIFHPDQLHFHAMSSTEFLSRYAQLPISDTSCVMQRMPASIRQRTGEGRIRLVHSDRSKPKT
jgi:hypothetical protein